jgi:hypothetical protein
MHDLPLICQIIALVCFAIAGLNWSMPIKHPMSWRDWGFFFVLLSFMITSVAIGLHEVRQ